MMTEVKMMAACKAGLQLLAAAGGVGIREDALRDQLNYAAGGNLEPVEIDTVMTRLNERKWMSWYRDPTWNQIRWTISATGSLALQAM